MRSVRDVVQNCLGKSGNLSLLRDVFGVYGVNPKVSNRSLRVQLDLIQNRPFVRVALVTIVGANNSNLQRDLDNASMIYQSEIKAWVYCTGSITVNAPHLLYLDQNDANYTDHIVSDDEDDLFGRGRNLGANIVCYYIDGSNFTNLTAGCAAHPPGRRGLWVNQNSIGYSEWTFAHELTHIVGSNRHICDRDNLMLGGPRCPYSGTPNITHPPPDLYIDQRVQILLDPDVQSCS